MDEFLKQAIGHALVPEPQLQKPQPFSCFGDETIKPVVMRTRKRYILSDEGLIFLKLEQRYLSKLLKPMRGHAAIARPDLVRLLGNVMANICRRAEVRFLWPYLHRWDHWPIGYFVDEQMDEEKRTFCKAIWNVYEETKYTMRAFDLVSDEDHEAEDVRETRPIKRGRRQGGGKGAVQNGKG